MQCLNFQMCDSLELLLLSILAPTIHCLWHLSSWEEAFITTVRNCLWCLKRQLTSFFWTRGKKSWCNCGRWVVLSPIWPGYNSWLNVCHIWVKFICSLIFSERFFHGYFGILSLKINVLFGLIYNLSITRGLANSTQSDNYRFCW